MPSPIHYRLPQTTALPPPVTAAELAVSPVTRTVRENALREAVLDNLGRPDDLQEVAVKQLGDANHYRVNIYREVRGVRTMTDSFHILMVRDGVVASPPIERKYYDDFLADYRKGGGASSTS